MSPSLSLRQLENLKSGNYVGTGEGGGLVTQERTTESDTAKVDTSAKSDAPDASNASDGSKINNPKIYVEKGIGKPCAVAILLSQHIYLRQQALRDAHSDGEGVDTGNFDATIHAKKEAKKADAK